MITRFDHAVIAVRDLERALDDYAALGFDVAPGGRHPGLGTANGIVRFGLDYLELLAIEDAAQARNAGAFGAELDAFLATGEGLIGFVLASSALDEEADALRRLDQAFTGPFAMDRERPDGRRLAWRLVIPGSSPWRKPWPFLIEWETPDDERVTWDASGAHDNGVTGVAGVDIVVADVDAARRFYEQGLGLQAADAAGGAACYRLGAFELTVRGPDNDDLARELNARGPGPWRLRFHAPRATAFDRALAHDARLEVNE